MLRAALKGLWAHKLRTVLLSLAVVTGVSFVVAAFVFTDTIGAAFDELFDEAFAGVDVAVQPVIDTDLDFGFALPRIDEGLAPDIASIDGVTGVWPSLGGLAQVVIDGEPIDTRGAPSFAVGWTGSPAGFVIREGRPPESPDEVAVDVATADANGLTLGSDVEIIANGPVESYRVVGTLGFGSADNLFGSTFVAFDLDTAQRVLDAEGRVDGFEVTIDPDADLDAVLATLNDLLPDQAEAVSAQTAAEEQAAAIREGLAFLNTFLLVFAGIALFAGTFVIYNAFRIVVAQRSRELALLRAIGATRQQVTGSVVAESIVTGVAASVLGVGGGVVLAVVLERALELLFSGNLPAGPLTVQVRTIVTALVVGSGVTVVSALLPAWRAGRVPPVAALRESAVPPEDPAPWRRIALGSVLAVSGGGLVLYALVGEPGNALTLVGFGAAVLFIGVYVLSPLFTRPVSAVVARPLPGETAKLAHRNATRSPRRTAATAGALMIGLALVTATAILATSVRSSTADAIAAVFRADLIVQHQQAFTGLSVSPEVADRIGQLPEVAFVNRGRTVQARIDEDVRFVAGVEPETIRLAFAITEEAGTLDDLQGDTIAVESDAASDAGIGLGDQLQLSFIDGTSRPFRVVATWSVASAFGAGGDWWIPYETLAGIFPEQGDQQLLVGLSSGVELSAGITTIEGVLEQFPGVAVQTQGDLQEQIESQLDSLLFLILGLLAMSIIVALIGITLTLLLSIFERTRELGLLRAVGMTRRQVRRMVAYESVIVAVFGAVLGVGVGMFLGWALGLALADEGLALTVPVGWILGGFAGAALAGVASSVWPAFRASNLDMLQAIAYE